MKLNRAFVTSAMAVLLLGALPISGAIFFRNSLSGALEIPLTLSRQLAQSALDLYYFKRNAEQVRMLKRELSELELGNFRYGELLLENERLTGLLNLKSLYPKDSALSAVFCRVIGRSDLASSRVLLLDKGLNDRVRSQQAVLSGNYLVGKTIDPGSSTATVLLITDPGCKIGVLIQRTRQQGVLYGTASGECRVKYIPMDAQIRVGDVVETVGHGGVIPKGLVVGTVQKAWKEKGQIYQVAQIKPLADLNRIEEVAVLAVGEKA